MIYIIFFLRSISISLHISFHFWNFFLSFAWRVQRFLWPVLFDVCLNSWIFHCPVDHLSLNSRYFRSPSEWAPLLTVVTSSSGLRDRRNDSHLMNWWAALTMKHSLIGSTFIRRTKCLFLCALKCFLMFGRILLFWPMYVPCSIKPILFLGLDTFLIFEKETQSWTIISVIYLQSTKMCPLFSSRLRVKKPDGLQQVKF